MTVGCPRGVALGMERSGGMGNVFGRGKSCLAVPEKLPWERRHAHINTSPPPPPWWTFFTKYLSDYEIMGHQWETSRFGRMGSTRRGESAVWGAQGVALLWLCGSRHFLPVWIPGRVATHTVYLLANQSIMKVKSENSALAPEWNRIQKRLSQI